MSHCISLIFFIQWNKNPDKNNTPHPDKLVDLITYRCKMSSIFLSIQVSNQQDLKYKPSSPYPMQILMVRGYCLIKLGCFGISLTMHLPL